MSIKINRLEVENLKRVKAVVLEPSENGLTVIGGGNDQGKTSVLDAITWALGGDRKRPSEPRRDGSVLPPSVKVMLSNGLRVERTGANSALKVIDPSGNKNGQQLLNDFIAELALDLPKFLRMSSKEKAQTLLKIIGVGDRLFELESKEQKLYNERHEIGRIADQKKKYADELTEYPDVPAEPVSASELIRTQQDILARNGENARKRANLARLEADAENIRIKIGELLSKQKEILADLEIAKMSAENLEDASTAEIEKSLADIDEINRRVRANADKEKAASEAAEYAARCADLTAEIERAREAKIDLLNGAKLPLPGLSVEDGELTYKGYKWDNMSGSAQLKVSTAIVRKLNPECGFVLLDKLEQMDLGTLKEFGAWLEAENLQVIATRVSTGDECSIIISDGEVVGAETDRPAVGAAPTTWRTGEF